MSFAVDVKAVAARRVVNPELLPDRPTRILVADDEHLVAADLTLTLGDLGFTTIGPATDGQSAVDLARTSRPHLAILDIRMPRMDGLAAAHILYHELGIPCVILSAYSEPEHVAQAEGAGVFGYIVKPAQRDQILASLAIAWSRFRDLALRSMEARELAQKLEDRKIIEKAKWILVSEKHIGEPDAMRILQKTARDSRRSLVAVAMEIVQDRGGEL